MANNVIVTPSASYTVAAEDIGVSVEVQRVKVVIGTAGVDGGNVGLTNPMPVTGIVSAQVSGAVSVSAMPAVSISVSAVLGTIITQLGTQVVTVVPGVSVNALVTGVVSVSVLPAVSISVSAALGTVITVLGTLAVNVVAGGAGGGSVTTAPPSVSASGQLMWVAGGQSSTANPVFVSGSVAISGAITAPVATSQVNTTGMLVWLAPTQTVVVTGTVTAGAGTTVVSIGNVVPVTTAASVSVSGLPVWLNPTQTVVVSGAISAVTTAQASGVTGLLVWLAASQTMIISATAAFSTTALATTTQAAVTGAVVWLAPTQTVNATVNTLAAGFSVNALVTGVVSVSVMPAVSLSVSAALGTVITILGTQVVSVVPGVSVNALVTGVVSVSVLPAISVSVSAILGTVVTLLGTVAVNVVAGGAGGGSVTTAVPSVSASGQVMWIVGGQSTTAFPVVVTGTVTAGAGTTVVSIGNIVPVTTAASVSVTGLPVWLNPTQAVAVNTIAAGFSVNALVTGVVSVSVLPAVSLSVSAALGTVITILGTQVVSVVPGLSVLAAISSIVPVTTAASVSVSGLPVWLNPTQTVVVSGAITAVSTTGASGVTGLVVWLGASQLLATVQTIVTVLGTVSVNDIDISATTSGLASGGTGIAVWPGTPIYQPFLLMVSSTVGLSAGSMYLFTVWTAGGQAAAGTSAWAPGKAVRLLNIQAALVSSVVIGGSVQFHVVAATATASLVSGSINTVAHPVLLQMQIPGVSTSFGSLIGFQADVPAATTIGVWVTMATSCTIPNIIVQGFLF